MFNKDINVIVNLNLFDLFILKELSISIELFIE